MFICLAVSIFSKEVIQLMAKNEEFWASWIIVPVISFSYILHGIGNFVGWGLVMTKKAKYINLNVGITAFTNIVLNVIFIPVWGIMGAAIATVISYVIWDALKLYFSNKYYQLSFDLRRLGYITIVGFSLYFISAIAANTEYLAVNIIIKLSVLLIYPAIFALFKLYTPGEVLHLKKLWSYIKEMRIKEGYNKLRAP
jgi:O-antigen/teichoic acid export membrane protein